VHRTERNNIPRDHIDLRKKDGITVNSYHVLGDTSAATRHVRSTFKARL